MKRKLEVKGVKKRRNKRNKMTKGGLSKKKLNFRKFKIRKWFFSFFLFVCACMCMCLSTYVRVFMCMSVYARMCMCVCVFVHTG